MPRTTLASRVLTNLIIGGLASGSLYAMVGIAVAIVLRVTDIANFAQGEMAMVTTFIAYVLLNQLGLSWGVACALALLFGLVQGVAVQQVIVRPLIGSPALSAIIATLGLNAVLHSLAGIIWGHQTHIFPSPFFGPPLSIAGFNVALDSAVNIAVAAALIVGLTAFLRLTWTGLSLRAASQNQVVARLMGVSIDRSFAIAWALGGLCGGLAGILVAPQLFLDTNMMGMLLIKAFAGGVLGGLSSLGGVFVGCLMLGVLENLVAAYISASFGEAITFASIIAILMVRSEGLFGQARVRKV